MRERRARAKNDKRPVVDFGSVVQRGSGPVIARGPVRGGPIRRGGGAGAVKFLIFVALLGVAYYAAGAYREKIVEALPQAYPVLKAIGIEVAEPVGFGLRIESEATRARDENQQWVVYVRGKITNTRDQRTAVPRLQITVKARNSRDLMWTIEPELRSLAPGQQTEFRSRYNTTFALIDLRAQVKFVNR